MILEGDGTAWGSIWALLGAPGPFWGRSRWSFFEALVQNELQEAFWRDLGWVWGGFGTDFGRIWQGFGKVLGGFEKFWEDLGKVLEAFSQAFLCQDPRAVSRSPAERLNARGSSTPRVLDFLDIRLSQFLPWEGLRPLWRRVRGGRR